MTARELRHLFREMLPYIIGAVLLFSLLLLFGALLNGRPAGAADVEGRAQALRALQSSVVLSEFRDRPPGCGGVLAEAPKYVITAYHCVSRVMWLTSYNGLSARAKVVRLEPLYDLAILETETDLGGRSPQLATEVVAGDRVWVVGAPDNEAFVVTLGIVSKVRPRKFENCPGSAEEKVSLGTAVHQQLFITAPTFFGNSGGGVFNADGQLVGVMVRAAIAKSGDCSDTSPYAGQHIIWSYAVGVDTLREKLR